jgi:hypothetical protein
MLNQDLKFSTEYSYRIKVLVLGAKGKFFHKIVCRIWKEFSHIYLQARRPSSAQDIQSINRRCHQKESLYQSQQRRILKTAFLVQNALMGHYLGRVY